MSSYFSKSLSVSKFLVTTLLLCMAQIGSAETLLDVYRDALKHDPSFAKSLAEWDIAVSDKKITKGSLRPNVNASARMNQTSRDYDNQATANGITLDDEFSETNWQVSLVQPIVDLPKWHEYKRSKTAFKMAESAKATDRQELIVRTVEAYLKVLHAKNLLRAVEGEEASVRQQLVEVQKRFDAGIIALTDVLEAQSIHDATVIRRIQAESAKENAFEDLRTLTSFSYQRIDDISVDLPMLSPQPANEELWIERAFAHNPAIEEARQNLVSIEQRYKAVHSKRLPTVNAVLQHLNQDGAADPALGSGYTETSIGLALNWNLYDGGKRSPMIKKAKAEIAVAQAELRKIELEIDSKTRNKLRSLNSDVGRVDAGRVAIESASTALRAVSAGYEAGNRGIVDLLQAQQRLYAAEYNFSEARHNYIRNLIHLKASVGQLTEDYLRQVNAYCVGSEAVWRPSATKENVLRLPANNSQLNRLL
ncbi:MAG: TolC family outer membrane protein [Cellvibrionales bacterium]|jgi:outer membrane protein|nr:TolC family outer membrane protein [Cellvibrionales bacterium]